MIITNKLGSNAIIIYNIILLLFYIWFCIKHKKSSLSLLIITLFFNGLFVDFSQLFNSQIINNIYKIVVFIWTLFLFFRYYKKINFKYYKWITVFFALFCLYFFISAVLIHQSSILLTFSQLSRYIIPYLLLLVMDSVAGRYNKIITLNKLFGRLIFVQILFNVFKLLIIQNQYEGLVGSITGVNGGGAGTTLPLLGLIWLSLNNRMSFKSKDIWIIIGLLFIGFMTGKRAVWFLFPLLFLILSIYVFNNKNITITILILPVIMYCGFRLIPTLNPEKKIWGRFDAQYTWNYVMKYSTGKNFSDSNIQEGEGRIGALALVWNNIFEPSKQTKRLFIGNGLEYFYYADYNNYINSNYYDGINSRGSVTGLIQFIFVIGLIGCLLFLVYLIILICSGIKFKRLRYTILFLVLFDFIFYNATSVQLQSLTVLLMFIILYANNIFDIHGDIIKRQINT